MDIKNKNNSSSLIKIFFSVSAFFAKLIHNELCYELVQNKHKYS